jgi:adenosylcobinamide-GDP ribazoletransferase
MLKSFLYNFIYQVQLFFTAVQFFTRIPTPAIKNYNDAYLQHCSKYFTWVGLIVGAVAAFSYWGSGFLFSPALSIAFSMLSTILLTGAFHEDGFADCCDAFGGGYTKEKILTIMKDSRLGTYGVVGLVSILTFKFLLLVELTQKISLFSFIWIIVVAQSTSRFTPLLIMQTLPYTQDIDASKTKPLANTKLSALDFAVALFVLTILSVYNIKLFIAGFGIQLLISLACKQYFKKWIQGYTGDCLGATQQLAEIGFYFTTTILFKFFLL